MTEEETIFDPSSKKKKKKTAFDLDAALAQAGNEEPAGDSNEKENHEPADVDDDDLDGSKKKKKKKKPFGSDSVDGVLPDKEGGTVNESSAHDDGGNEEDFGFDIDLSKTKKKKKKKTTFDLDAALAQAGNEEPVGDSNEKENHEPADVDGDDNLDLEIGGKKKKKKKKPFSSDDIDGALQDKEGNTVNESAHDDGGTEEDFSFDIDFSKTKKKKKKKTTFDLDAALAQAGNEEGVDPSEKENQEPADVDGDDNLDLEIAGKKKKKKKPFNFKDLDGAFPDKEDGTNDSTAHDDGGIENDFNLDMDFSKTKKKKKKKKDLEELVAEEEKEKAEEKDNVEDVNLTWSGSDRDYTYDELLTRVFDILRDKNPDMVAGKKQKFIMRPPQVVRIGTKKTSFVNFADFCTTLHRQPKHLLDFLLAELGTSGSVDGNNQLIIKGRFLQKQIENVLRRYIKEYVTCHTCRSPDTILRKDTRLFFLLCETCGSRCSVASIKSGFQAVTGKRAAIRAKTA